MSDPKYCIYNGRIRKIVEITTEAELYSAEGGCSGDEIVILDGEEYISSSKVLMLTRRDLRIALLKLWYLKLLPTWKNFRSKDGINPKESILENNNNIDF